jgi:hypothetical protein
MPERKPPGVGWETWIDRQIREATERAEFDNLPGAGAPLADLDKPFDEMWWVKRKLRSEGLTYQPPSLALRKDAQDALALRRSCSPGAPARQVTPSSGKVQTPTHAVRPFWARFRSG